MNPSILDNLSVTQRLAAETLNVPVCILAGAGSGKTRVITHRIAWLLESGQTHARHMMAVTFTNKAAREMRERIELLAPYTASSLLCGTFHSLAVRFLRMYGSSIQLPSTFLIYDQDDAEKILTKSLVEDCQYSKDMLPSCRTLIEQWQNRGWWPNEVHISSELKIQQAHQVYIAYQHRLQQAGALDFNGLLLSFLKLLQQPVSSSILRLVRHIVVDEYQDTSDVQASIVYAFAKQADSVAIVGDDDQSIYSWRGASPDNLKNFCRVFPTTTIIKLEENYRSVQPILDAANHMIACNQNRMGKNLIAHRSGGQRLLLVRCMDETEEARKAVLWILDAMRQHIRLTDMAILYRTNSMSRLFEDELRRHRLGYRIVGGTRFYDRKEIKDVVALVRILIHPQSNIDFLRALMAIPRGIGASTIKKIEDAAQENECSLFEIVTTEKLSELGLTARVLKRIQEWSMLLLSLRQTLFKKEENLICIHHAAESLRMIIEASGIVQYLSQESHHENETRLENIQQLMNAAAEFVETAQRQHTPDHIIQFLEDISLLTTEENPQHSVSSDQITLMTVHMAKGLNLMLCG